MKTAAILAGVLCIVTPVTAKEKPKEWCLGNGCISGGGGADKHPYEADMLKWHVCRPGEPNICRQWSVQKPK